MDLVVIPGGMTSIRQQPDFSVYWPFRSNSGVVTPSGLAADIHEGMPTGRLTGASLQQVCLRMLSAPRSVSCDTIVKSLKVMGIANRKDGMEDDLLC
ncbi:hypothetical protein HPB48_009099 [Haemaphysalis longicornis]|uniref:Uncharacterized protein n=1 Tax=Haemaphysalis longicornis TaxID=44386 RepID=A0A9J6GGD4_HAELO|nr:hypothetical protein HPB48_009099 [Haemaphysalis longicornis]